MDVVVCNISTDAVFSGGYVTRDGTEVKRGELPRPKPGEAFAFTLDRFVRITRTMEDGDAVLATSPEAVLEGKHWAIQNTFTLPTQKALRDTRAAHSYHQELQS